MEMEASAGNHYQFHLTLHNQIFGVWVVEIIFVCGETRNSEPRNTRPQGRGKGLFFYRYPFITVRFWGKALSSFI